jgi:hypothetical protein
MGIYFRGLEANHLHIYVDADACPVKQEVIRVARRYDLAITFVSDKWLRIPDHAFLTLKVVNQGPDAADDWIVDHVERNDIVVSADIHLASKCLKKDAGAIAPNGRLFTDENIGMSVATRDLLAGLRQSGEHTGGPAPFGKQDRSRFLHQLDQLIARRLGN